MTGGQSEPGAEVLLHRDVSYEVELDTGPGAEVVPVDPPDSRYPVPVIRAETRLAIIPDHLKTVQGVRSAAAHHAGRQWHRARYHGLRSPRYLLAALAWAIVGLFRMIGRQLRWWWILEQHSLRSQAAADGDSREWMRLHKEAKETRKIRGIVLAAEAVILLIGCALLATIAPVWIRILVTGVAVILLAAAGHPADRRIIGPAVITPRFRKLSADIVLRAYYAAGLGDPEKPGQQVTFGSTMSRDGDGSRVLVDLPYGRGLDDAVKARPKIASGLDVTESQVYIRRDPTSHRRHTLWVADRDPLAVPVGKTPLLACKATDIWHPAPLGLDERGQLVTVPLLWHSVLVGALPRQGKSWSARLLGLYAALDPHVTLDVFDASGKPDWRKFALAAHSCAFGLTPTRDGLPPEILLATLEAIKRDVQDRYHRLSQLPTHICPEGKLTRDIARDPRMAMPVRLLIVDEVQEYFDLGAISAAIADLLVYICKVAPGAGVSVIDATQRPSGIGTGTVANRFLAFRDNHQIRLALRTSDYRVSEMVLGAGSLGEGLDSSKLLAEYKGVGILRGGTDTSPVVRCFYADDRDAERILLAARGLRERAGTLAGMALGEETPAARDVLGDVLAVFGAEQGLHWQIIAERLAAQFPGRWAGATGDAVSAQCRALGVPSRQVKTGGQNRQGCYRADVQAATR
jgi:DNA segregation ATPase FtsK/SpoIIIE, S-DNA-T family